jgi:hypothetical protein
MRCQEPVLRDILSIYSDQKAAFSGSFSLEAFPAHFFIDKINNF